MLKRQEAWDCVKRYAIFSLWKCIPFSKMLLKMIFAFQSHQAMPGYMVSYHSPSVRQVVLLGMLCLLIGRICSAKEGMISNRFGPWVHWTFDMPASGNVKKKKKHKQLRNMLQNIRVLSSVWKGTGIAQNLSQQWPSPLDWYPATFCSVWCPFIRPTKAGGIAKLYLGKSVSQRKYSVNVVVFKLNVD